MPKSRRWSILSDWATGAAGTAAGISRPVELRRATGSGADWGAGCLNAWGAAREAVMREERAKGRTGEIFMLMWMNGCGGRVLGT